MANTIRIKKRAASGSAGAPQFISIRVSFNEAGLKQQYGFGDNGSTPPSASSIIVGGAGAFFNKTMRTVIQY